MARQRWPRFVVVLEARPPAAREGMPAPAPPALRLRQALKLLGRAFGLVCVRVEPAGDGQGAGAEPCSDAGGQHERSTDPG